MFKKDFATRTIFCNIFLYLEMLVDLGAVINHFLFCKEVVDRIYLAHISTHTPHDLPWPR